MYNNAISGQEGGRKMPRSRRTSGGSINEIRTAVRGVCSCAHFTPNYLTLPTKIGAQLSMTGDTIACGNLCEMEYGRISAFLRAYPPADTKKLIERRRFLLLCGEFDRTVAIIGALKELIHAGVTKIVICTETPAERDALTESLEIIADSYGVTSYRPGEYDSGARYILSASIYSFIASTRPEILVIGRDCVTKRTNLIRQSDTGEDSLTELISKLHPAVITSSRKISSGRSIAKTCGIFDPSITFVFSEEVKNLRDAVIYRPNDSLPEADEERSEPMPEQLSF